MPFWVLLFRIFKFFNNNCLYLVSNSVLPNLIATRGGARKEKKIYGKGGGRKRIANFLDYIFLTTLARMIK